MIDDELLDSRILELYNFFFDMDEENAAILRNNLTVLSQEEKIVAFKVLYSHYQKSQNIITDFSNRVMLSNNEYLELLEKTDADNILTKI